MDQEIIFYCDKDRETPPFVKWLDDMPDRRTANRIRIRINRLRLGSFGDCKRLKPYIWELRIHFGPGYRVYFSRMKPNLVILLCGGSKKTQKKDLLKSICYLQAFLRSNLL